MAPLDAPLLEGSSRGGVARWAPTAAGAVMAAFGGSCLLLSQQQAQQRQTVVPATSLKVFDPPGGFGAPLAKQVVVGMDTNINLHMNWGDWESWNAEMEPYWTKDMIYDFNYVGEWNFGPQHGLRAWFEGEHMHFNRAMPDCQWMDFIRAAGEQTCTSASYGITRWVDDFAGVPPPASKPWVNVRDLDFYLLEGERIKVNWCIIDVVDLFQQAGYNVLPPAPMSTLGYLAPHTMDGFPAPYSGAVDPQWTVESEKIWRAALQEDYVTGSLAGAQWAEELTWYGPGGIGTARTRSDYVRHFVKPLHEAFSDISMKADVIICEGTYCGAHFYLYGTHTGTWLGEAATGRRVSIRCGAHAHIVGGKIAEGWLIIDVPLAFHTMGVDLYARAKEIARQQALSGLSVGLHAHNGTALFP